MTSIGAKFYKVNRRAKRLRIFLPFHKNRMRSIRSGTLCAPIPLSKNSAKKSSREDTNYTKGHEF